MSGFGSDDEAEVAALDNNSTSGTRSLRLILIVIDDTLVQKRKMKYSS